MVRQMFFPIALVLLSSVPMWAADEYSESIQPLLKRYCLSCHSAAQKIGELDLERFADIEQVRQDLQAWSRVIEMLEVEDMPPQTSPQPSPQQRLQIVQWARSFLAEEARAGSGDPGRVVLRRLSNAQYTYTLRDLLGVDLRPARQFPIDGAAGEGFTNTGESLVMSPALLEKYLDAARKIARHAVLLPDGIRFSKYDSRRDWTDEVVDKIRAFYGRTPR